MELTANLFDHAVSCLGNGVHGHCREHEREHAADEQTDNDGGAGQCDLVCGQAGCLSEGNEQSKCGQSCRADREALAHCCGGVADCVELVGDLTHGVVKAAHLCDAAGIVGDGAVSINRDGDAGGGEHADCCKSNAVQACKLVSKEDAYADENDGNPGGHHADCGAGDDGGCGTCLGLLSDLLNELVVAGGVDLGDDTDDKADDQTGNDRNSGTVAVEHDLAEDDGCDNNKKGGNIRAHLQCLVGVGAFLAANKESSDNGCENAACRDDQREDNGQIAELGNDNCAEGHCGDDSSDIALEQVSAHACNVAYVVADVICDNCRVAGVVLGDACLDLADEVCADVSSLGVDTAADTGKQSDRACAEGEAEQNVGVLENEEQDGCAEKAEADNAHAHDRAAGECDRQSLVHAACACCVCGADVSLGCNIHADVACKDGEQSTEQEAKCGDPAAQTEADGNKQNDYEDRKDLVLCKKESLCAIVDSRCDFLHALGTCVLLGDECYLIESKQQSDHCESRCQELKGFHKIHSY